MSHKDEIDVDMDDRLEDMARNNGEDHFKRGRLYETLCTNKWIKIHTGWSLQGSLYERTFYYNITNKNKCFMPLVLLIIDDQLFSKKTNSR